MNTLAVVVAGVLAAGAAMSEASEPPAPPSAASPQQTAQATATKPGTQVLVDDTVTDAQLKQILAQGYRPEKQVYGDEVLYCRNEQLAGDRFQTKVCKTAVRILEDQRRGRAFTDSVQRMGLTTPR